MELEGYEIHFFTRKVRLKQFFNFKIKISTK